MEPFELRDGDVVLRAPALADVDRITDLCQDPDIQRWTTVPSPYSREDAVGFLEHLVEPGWRGGSPTWGLRLDGRLLGMIGLRKDGDSAEIGYWLGPEARGRGLMHRAIGLVLDEAFGPLALEHLTWRADVGNWPSWRTVWRHGFRKEGQVRGLGVNNGRRVDQWIGTLLRSDPRRPAAPWDGPTPVAACAAPIDGERPDALVREFHRHFGVPIADDAPSVDRSRVHLRMALIAEEFAELVEAVHGAAATATVQVAYRSAVAADDGHRDTVAAADALADLVYVLYGMAQECGIPLPAVLAEVHAANLSKLGPDGPLLRQDGKVLKAPGYRPPDVAAVLASAARAVGGE